jgi:hypothetical protein
MTDLDWEYMDGKKRKGIIRQVKKDDKKVESPKDDGDIVFVDVESKHDDRQNYNKNLYHAESLEEMELSLFSQLICNKEAKFCADGIGTNQLIYSRIVGFL